jgi:hypothetical protein
MNWESADHRTLHQLWEQADMILGEVRAMVARGFSPGDDWQLVRAAGGPADSVFDPIGLLLVDPLEHYGYEWATPVNSLAFAATGGNGVHFSFVLLDGRLSVNSPVVMTVPNDSTNIILGANLDEFLGLGMFRGYFSLEFLAMQTEKYAEAYTIREPRPDDGEGSRWLLQRFAEGMGLHPWAKVHARLNQLQREFSPLLTWEDEPPGDNNLWF